MLDWLAQRNSRGAVTLFEDESGEFVMRAPGSKLTPASTGTVRIVISYTSLVALGIGVILKCITWVANAPDATQSGATHIAADVAGEAAPVTDAVYTSALPERIGPQIPMQFDNPLAGIPLASLTATRERPIFYASRRPPIESAPIEKKIIPLGIERPRPPPLALLGSIAVERRGSAIFVDETTKSVIRLNLGESYAGWTLRSVTARDVTLQKDGESAIFSLPNPPAK
jgi:general secretion pathway protein N